MNPNKNDEEKGDNKTLQNGVEIEAETSMTTLILWNISKALQRNPHLNLKLAINNAYERLDNSRDVNKFVTQSPEERHLACALLAWQELGHTTAESLYEFVEDKFGDQERDKGEQTTEETRETKKTEQLIKNADITDQSKDAETLKLQPSESSKHPKYVQRSSKECKSGLVTVRKSRTEITKNNDGTFRYNIYKEEVLTNNSCNATDSIPCTMQNRNKKEFGSCKFKAAANNTEFYGTSSAEPIECDSCELFDSCSLKGPVVTLPPETKVVMRLDNQGSPCSRHQGKKPRAQEKDIMSKIDKACCMDSGCAERLAELDKATTELRNRAAKLARREAERMLLLERAEAAWKDLEMGYQRRLTLAEEKEYDMVKQTKKLIEDRNGYKSCCLNLAKLLKERGESTEKDRATLVEVEREMCALACMRMRLSEDAARSDSGNTEQHIKVSQLDRDLQFKEDQTRRKLSGVQSEVESVRALAVAAERAMRAELSALKEQVTTVSKQLLREDDQNHQIQAELDSLRAEKLNMVEDLEGCQLKCDAGMQKKMDELKKARELLAELKEKVIECQCKLPVDASVEVKRTPSLAALCTCSPEDKIVESCSCTSLRSQLLSNLLADLFGGLQAELGELGLKMPCQLLKCLEDKHNWDKGSLVKTNLRTFFSNMLIGELDIAIATSIEKYHAKWVGASCADALRMIPDPGESNNEGWQERAIERRAQKLANKLAEQLFQERAEQLVQRAKDVVQSGPPPCECKETAVYPCLVKPPTIGGGRYSDNNAIPTYWRKTFKDVTQLRVQIENLKKETLKKEDLKKMEENIFKLVQRPSEPEPPIVVKEDNPKALTITEGNKDIKFNHRSVNTAGTKYSAQSSRSTSIRKKHLEYNSLPKKNTKKAFNEQQDRTSKNSKKVSLIQEFAVNTCFCGNQSLMPKLISEDGQHEVEAENEDKSFREQPFQSSKQSKPISKEFNSTMTNLKKSNTHVSSCKSGCVCFHKMPSNTSIDKLLEKLTKWKFDLIETPEESVKKNMPPNIKGINNQQRRYRSSKHELGIQSNITYQDSSFKFSTDINKPTDMNTITNILPNTTDSEYMGAINLEKSNDQCKCIIKQQKVNKDNKDEKMQDSIFKCINSELCECKKSSNIISKNTRQESFKKTIGTKDAKGLMLETEKKNRNSDIPNKGQNSSNLIKRPSEHVEVNKKTKNETETDENHVVKTSELLPCDCDYYIKLLGVTLANISSHKVFDDKLAISDRKHKTETTINSNNLGTAKHSSNQNARNIQSCQCHVKFDEFKDYMEKNFRKQWDNQTKDDKELDVPSFKGTISSNEEACVCCNTCPINESKELEVNTFYLLEEHLRGRLEELKKSCCKFSCLPAGEEEKLFSAILQRVRQIISSSTNELTCKCKEGTQTDGSWNRANTLLQEYLKTKIKKVQCLCADDDPKQECVLPKVLDEIYSLIEQDFQRLKNVYNYQNTPLNVNNKEDKGEIPEKDTSYNNPTPRKNIERSSKSNSNKSMIQTQSMSAQVPVNLGMDSKSCDCEFAEKGTKDVQTTDSIKSVTKTCDSRSVDTQNCYCDAMIDSYNFGTQEVFVNHHVSRISNNEFPNNSKKIDLEDNNLNSAEILNKPSSSPYIGYTIDCSCKCALGTCTCIKSTIKGNNEQINTIWNDLTKDNIQSQNISYIMGSISEKHKNKPIDFTGLDDKPVKSTHSNQTTKSNESGISDEEIVLKDSYRNIMVSNNSVNTSNGNAFVGEDRTKTEERYENCGCRRVIKPILKNNVRSESHLPYSTNMHKTPLMNCDCTMVPICHVKMLVDNLENRLFNSKCTCDSFDARVCPIHSKSN